MTAPPEPYSNEEIAVEVPAMLAAATMMLGSLQREAAECNRRVAASLLELQRLREERQRPPAEEAVKAAEDTYYEGYTFGCPERRWIEEMLTAAYRAQFGSAPQQKEEVCALCLAGSPVSADGQHSVDCPHVYGFQQKEGEG